MIVRVDLTWQAALESVANFSVPGITLPLRLSPMLFGKTPSISLREQHRRTSGKLLPPLLFPPVKRVLIAVPPARMEASPPQPAPVSLPAGASSPLRRGCRLRISCPLFSWRFKDFSVVVQSWLNGHCPPSGFSCSVVLRAHVVSYACMMLLARIWGE